MNSSPQLLTTQRPDCIAEADQATEVFVTLNSSGFTQRSALPNLPVKCTFATGFYRFLLKTILFCFIIGIANSAAYSQKQQTDFLPDQYRAVLWTKSEGLSDDFLNVMIKDVKGFLWIASDANSKLTRFDGMEFKKYTLDPKKPATVSGKIMALKEDSLHNIWMGTYTGLVRYDIKADTFTNFPAPVNTDPNGWGQTSIPVWATRDEMICIESGTTVVTYNIHSLVRKKLLSIPKSYGLNYGYASTYAIFDASSNNLWMLPVWAEEGLIQISLSDGKITKHTRPNYKDGPTSGQKGAEGMCYDRKRHCIWINSHDGLEQFRLNDQQFHHVDAMNEYVRLKNYSRFVGIDIDKNGRIWLTTHPKGILVYNPETDRVQPVFTDPELIRKTGEFNLHLYCDRDGIVWASYWGQSGLYSLLPFNKLVTSYSAKPGATDSLSDGRIFSIVPAGKGKIWIGTGDGLNIFDPGSEKFEVLRAKDLPGIKGHTVIPLYIDTNRQTAWLFAGFPTPFRLTGMDIYEMNMVSRKCRPVMARFGGKRLDSIELMPAEVKPFKDGFLFYDGNYGVFQVNAGSPIAELVAPFNDFRQVSKMLLEEDRFLYLRVNGFNALNLNYENREGKWTKIPHILDSMEYVSMIYNKKDKTHWVSFNNELVHFDNHFKKIKTYRKEDGYTSEIINMVLDDSGNLWFINNLNEVGRLDIESGILSALSEVDGFYKKDFDGLAPIINDGRGNIYFGTGNYNSDGVKGWGRINPERYAPPNTSTAYLRSITINQKTYAGSVEANSIEVLSLAYDQNTIGVAAGTIDFYSKGKNYIRYKLEEAGKEKGWEYPMDKMIRLDGLSPGEYKLLIQASNTSNQFNSREKTIKIMIHPPFWDTWWFRILILAGGLMLVLGFFQYRSRNLRQRNVVLEEKVMSRTRELKHSLEDLRDTQSQLIQREKMASLGELTAGIAHEIQNPLNFVNNFSDLNKELLAEMDEELNAGNVAGAKSIAKDITENEDKIGRHGRRADAIVKGMLQHSQASSGQKERTAINALADEYLRLAYQGLRAKDKMFTVLLQTDFDQAIGEISIVPQDIGRVLLNLFNNAFYAVAEKKKQQLPDYEPTVSVSTKKMDAIIEIRVKDNGNGIPQKLKDKIFQPFFTTKPTGEGTGLGLSISYDIIKAHKGIVSVETREQEFTEFLILIPAV